MKYCLALYSHAQAGQDTTGYLYFASNVVQHIIQNVPMRKQLVHFDFVLDEFGVNQNFLFEFALTNHSSH
ncbi:Uncharacterised protein [Acinetobacter baumannii]|nr:Uncharacterised protein [Acinetobacter baumannii]